MNVLFEQREDFYCRPETLCIYWVGRREGAVAYQMCVGEQSVQEEGVFYYRRELKLLTHVANKKQDNF